MSPLCGLRARWMPAQYSSMHRPRLNAGDSYGMGADTGLSGSRLHAKGPIGLEQLTCEKYVAFGSGQLRYPHPVPETYFDAIMLKRP